VPWGVLLFPPQTGRVRHCTVPCWEERNPPGAYVKPCVQGTRTLDIGITPLLGMQEGVLGPLYLGVLPYLPVGWHPAVSIGFVPCQQGNMLQATVLLLLAYL
jgi:hypothetical protein